MAALIPTTRKRSRSVEEEDFLPLSKKINNLHINHWQSFGNDRQLIVENLVQNLVAPDMLPPWAPANMPMNKPLPPQAWPPSVYAPDLTVTENPFYYESNRLLFELYLSRVNRSNF